ncbi:MAG: DUF669 domain-containing protein [Candidatus Jettenia caeni]|nr:MAG: DUF669 domain-containing protein [Candidatus Jettenia caeni]
MSHYHFPEKEPAMYGLIEPGFYTVQIENIEERLTRRGAKMLTCLYRILNKIEYGKFNKHPGNLIFHNIVFPLPDDEPDKAAFMLDRIATFLKLLGEPYKGKIVINPSNWYGKELAIKVKHQEWNGGMQHAVHYVLAKEKALDITLQQTGDETEYLVPASSFAKSDNEKYKIEDDINNEDIPF